MRILIVRNNFNPKAIDASYMISAFLSAQGIDHQIKDTQELTSLRPGLRAPEGADFDVAFALGGDGTVLKCARFLGVRSTPIMGINYGRLGFLANSPDYGLVELVSAALSGDVHLEQRASLSIQLLSVDQVAQDIVSLPDEESYFSLNELALTRGALGRMIDFSLSISGSSVASLRGDGVVVASPTGSSAYALSAGGPLMSPDLQAMVVVPLAAHALNVRPVVCSSSDVVELELLPSHGSLEASIFIDGEPLICDQEDMPQRIVIKKNQNPSVLMRYKHEGFYAHAARTFFKS